MIYNTLTRLGDDYTVTRIGEPLSKRGGRAAKLYTLTKTGREALKETRESRASIMESLYQNARSHGVRAFLIKSPARNNNFFINAICLLRRSKHYMPYKVTLGSAMRQELSNQM